MEFKFMKRKEYSDYLRIPSKEDIKSELATMYNNPYFESDDFNITIDEPVGEYYYSIPNEYKAFCSRIKIDDNVTLLDVLCPANDVVGMETDDIKAEGVYVLDDTYLGYLDKAIRYIKMHDDSIYFEFNTDHDVIKLHSKDKDNISKFYIDFKNWIEFQYCRVGKFYEDLRYAEIVVKKV